VVLAVIDASTLDPAGAKGLGAIGAEEAGRKIAYGMPDVLGAAARFTLLNGAGNGILTIAPGALPLANFGPENYAYRLGLIGAPSRIAQALAPLAIGLLIDPLEEGVVAVTAGLS
jgi:hypothetical protein